MDFVDQLRRLQADESSDEESGRLLTSATAPAPRRTAAKRKAAPAEEADAETSRAAKKAKPAAPSPAAEGKLAPMANGSGSAPKTNGTTSTAKVIKPASSGARMEAEGGGRVAKAESSKAQSSKAAPGSRVSQKPAARTEYFEERAHDMLNNPLNFDDFVYDSTKPTPRHIARSFAQFRRRQTQPPPPLVMSGAIGPASDAKPATAKGSGSLAKEAQKRAHQQKVKEQVRSSKPHEEGRRSGGSKQSGVSGAKVSKGKGKERVWLTNSRQPSGVKQGGQHQARVKKYNKSTYSDAPTMSRAIAAKTDNANTHSSLDNRGSTEVTQHPKSHPSNPDHKPGNG